MQRFLHQKCLAEYNCNEALLTTLRAWYFDEFATTSIHTNQILIEEWKFDEIYSRCLISKASSSSYISCPVSQDNLWCGRRHFYPHLWASTYERSTSPFLGKVPKAIANRIPHKWNDPTSRSYTPSTDLLIVFSTLWNKRCPSSVISKALHPAISARQVPSVEFVSTITTLMRYIIKSYGSLPGKWWPAIWNILDSIERPAPAQLGDKSGPQSVTVVLLI